MATKKEITDIQIFASHLLLLFCKSQTCKNLQSYCSQHCIQGTVLMVRTTWWPELNAAANVGFSQEIEKGNCGVQFTFSFLFSSGSQLALNKRMMLNNGMVLPTFRVKLFHFLIDTT